MTLPISVMVLTLNSADHLRTCLESVQAFPEVVVCDNGSTDATLPIANSFSNVTIIHSPFIGFGPLRRLATATARHDWILALDSDEILSEPLYQELTSLALEDAAVYAISRHNHFDNQHIRCCGWYPDYVIRLFDRRLTGYTDHLVHESVMVPAGMRVRKLHNPIHHTPFARTADLIDKMQRYSDLYAKHHAHTRQVSVPLLLLKTIIAFIKNYFLQGGFRYGANGLLIAVSNANGVFYKYMKLRELNRIPQNNSPPSHSEQS